MYYNFRRAYNIVLILALVYQALLVSYAAGTAALTRISNQASVSYIQNSAVQNISSNIVETLVTGICSVSVTPDGDQTNPAHDLAMRGGGTVYLPYLLSNTGNQTNDYTLSANLLAASTVAPDGLHIFLDQNSNQQVDAGDTDITGTGLSLTADTTAALLLAVSVDASVTTGDIYLNLAAACQNDSSVQDDNNEARVRVVPGGVRDLLKSANPAEGTPVFTGEGLSYTVSFTVDDVALTNVILSDTLDPALELPPRLSLTLNNIDQSSLLSYDEISHTVSARFAQLEYGDRVSLSISTIVRADAAGNATVQNQAALSFDGGSDLTNTVNHPIVAVCRPQILPDGTLEAPAFAVSGIPGKRVSLAYTLTNEGNIPSSYALSTTTDSQSDWTSYSSFITEDLNNNGSADANETALSSILLQPAESKNLLLVVDLQGEASSFGDLFISPVASCQDSATNPGGRDANNLAHIRIPLGGFASAIKEADPVSGSALYPGAAIRYTVRSTLNERALNHLVITDVLDARLTAPSDISEGIIRDEARGLTATASATYDAASHTLRWHFDSVPAGMEVVVGFSSQVREDLGELPAESIISNTAVLSSEGNAPQPTNDVSHDLRPLVIELAKTASPERVGLGGTLSYTLTVSNPARSVTLSGLELSDQLPAEVSYLAGSSQLSYPGATPQTLEPTVNGQTLGWQLEGIAPGETLSLTFEVRVLAAALFVDEILNKAQVVATDASGRAVADAAASAVTTVDLGIFGVRPVLLGTAFLDVNKNGLYEQDEDTPVAGLRLYLADGSSTITDAAGRYTFLSLRPNLTTLRVDSSTAPARYFKETAGEDKTGLWRLRLEAGVITRQDIPFIAPELSLEVDQILNLYMGAVTVSKYVTPLTESRVRVTLTVNAAEALRGLTVSDQLPEDARLASQPESGLEFRFGDVAAGFNEVLEYEVMFTGLPTELLLPPAIRWNPR